MIDPNKYYNLNQIYKFGYFPWLKSLSSVRRWVEKDQRQGNLLKTIVVGYKTGKRYVIKGSDLNIFLDKIKDNTYFLR